MDPQKPVVETPTPATTVLTPGPAAPVEPVQVVQEDKPEYASIEPHIIENETQGNFLGAILRGGAAYIATQALAKKTSIGSNKGVVNAIALGTSFVVNMLNKEAGFKEAVVAAGAIASAQYYGPVFMKRDDSFYERIGKLNTIIAGVDNFNKKFTEAKLEVAQKFFVESKTNGNKDRISEGAGMIKEAIGYVFGTNALTKSKAYEFINNERGFHSKFLKENNVMDATMFRELESSLPSDVSDYAKRFFKLNQKIDQTSYDSSKLLAGVSYFTNKNKTIEDGFGNVDVLSVFKNNLNKEINIFFEEAADKRERFVEFHGTKENKVPYFYGVRKMFDDANIPDNVRKIKDRTERYDATVEYLKNSSDPVLSSIAGRQAKGNELTYGEFVTTYNNVLKEKTAEIKSIFNVYKNNLRLDETFVPTGKVSYFSKALELTKQDKGFEQAFKDIDEIKNSLSPYMFTAKFRKPTSEVVEDVLGGTVFSTVAKGNPSMLFEFNDKSDVFGKIIMNTRVHKFIEKNSEGKVFDTSAASFKNLGLSVMSKVSTAFTPYFKTSPFGGAIRSFNFASPFGIKEKVVKELDDSSLFSIQGQYDKKKTIAELDGVINYLDNVESEYDLGKLTDRNFTVGQALKKYRARYEVKRNERIDDYENNAGFSFEQTKARPIYNYNEIDSLAVLNKTRKAAIEARFLEEHKKDFKFELDEFGFRGDSAPRAFKKFGFSFDVQNGEVDGRIVKNTSVTVNNRTVHRNNILIKDNQLFVKTGESGTGHSFEKIADNVEYNSSNFAKKVQSDIRGLSYTTETNGSGTVVMKDEVPNTFDFQDFKKASNKLAYLRDSDVNYLPFSSKKAFNEEDSLFGFYKKRVTQEMAVNKNLKKNGEKTSIIDTYRFLTGEDINQRGARMLEKDELDLMFNSLRDNIKSNKGFDEYKNIVNNIKDNPVYSKYKPLFDDFDNISKVETDFMMKSKGLLDEIKIRKNDGEHVDISDETLGLAKTYENLRVSKIQTDGIVQRLSRKKLDESMLPEIETLYKSKLVENLYKNSGTIEEFEKVIPKEMLEKNTFYNYDRLARMNRVNPMTEARATFVKKSFADVDLKRDGFIKTVSKIVEEFRDTSSVNNKANMLLMKMSESAENVFNILGVPKLGPDSRTSGLKSAQDLLMKRIFPMIGGAYTMLAVNAGIDAALPDWVPIIGEGAVSAVAKSAAAARMSMQIAINATGIGATLRFLEDKYPGIISGNGLFAPLDLHDTNEAMYEKLFEGKEVEVKKNRFWYTSGRQAFEGGETKTFRPHLLYTLQHRDADVYDNKVERFFRKDFLPTSLPWYFADSYLEERRLSEKGVFMPRSERLFEDIPIIGGLLSTTLGEVIKPTKYFGEDKWRVDKDHIINPNYVPNNPNSQPVLRIHEANFLERSFLPMFNDLTDLFGMRGYYFKQGFNQIFGDPNISKYDTLDSLDRHRGLASAFEGMELGGMFGTTEGVRRILSANKLNQNGINPIENDSLPSWMPYDYYKAAFHRGKNTQFGYFADYSMPGEKYEKTYGLHSDEQYGEYGLLDRLRILSINAPDSDEFKNYRSQALRLVLGGDADEKQMKHIFESISYSESIKDNNIYENTTQKADLVKKEITVASVTGFNEFWDGDGKRYKLAGINMQAFSGNYRGSKEVSKDLKKYMEFLTNADTLNVYQNKSGLSSVKFDESGEYIEVYAPETDKFKSITQNSYLKSNYHGRSPILSGLNFFENMYKPNFQEKSYNKKDAYERWHDENVITPEFKDWGDPYGSFMAPMFDKSSQGIMGYLEAQEIAKNVGNGDLLLPILNTANFLKGMVWGDNRPENYERETLIQNTLEYQEHIAAKADGKMDTSFFSMSEGDTLGRMKSFLSPTERKYFQDLSNETNEKKREEIYKAASTRLQAVLDLAWLRRSKYAGEDYETHGQENLDSLEVVDLNPLLYEESYYDNRVGYARIKESLYGNANTYEQRNMASQVAKDSLQLNTEYIKEIVQKRREVVKKQTVLSTTFGIDASFIYNKESE